MTVRKVQFETMDDVNRFLNVTEHFPFAVSMENLFSELHPSVLAEKWIFVHMCRRLRRRLCPVLIFA